MPYIYIFSPIDNWSVATPAPYFTEERYGVELDPYQLKFTRQVGSLASESATAPIHPADAKVVRGETLNASRIQVNLRPITHPSELPPISMMNWLVLLEEHKREY